MRPGLGERGEIRAETAEDTRAFGERLGALLEAGDVVILDGPLGAGKTTMTQGLARGMGVRGRVTSPTFTIAREHRATEPGAPGPIHVDAYRLLGDGGGDPVGALDSLDLESRLDEAAVVAEWGEGLVGQIAGTCLVVHLDRTTAVEEDPDSEARIISWRWEGEDA